VTDEGLITLFSSLGATSSLRYLDLTFCGQTSYGATLKLRRACPLLKTIRRVPDWFDGHVITPFGPTSNETHTYYADGSFSYASGAKGYILKVREYVDKNFVAITLQFSRRRNDENRSWEVFFHLPEVALRPAADMCIEDSRVRNVLVAQSLLDPYSDPLYGEPVAWPRVLVDDLPLGHSCFFLEDGSLDDDLPFASTGVDQLLREAIDQGAVGMLSRMQILPLDSDMPPSDLVRELEELELQRLSVLDFLGQSPGASEGFARYAEHV